MGVGGTNLTSPIWACPYPHPQGPASSPPLPSPGRIRCVLVFSQGGRTWGSPAPIIGGPPRLQTLISTSSSPWALGTGTAGRAGDRTQPRLLGGSHVEHVEAVPKPGDQSSISVLFPKDDQGVLWWGLARGRRSGRGQVGGWSLRRSQAGLYCSALRFSGSSARFRPGGRTPRQRRPPCAPRRFRGGEVSPGALRRSRASGGYR